jgi:hypothetical protein
LVALLVVGGYVGYHYVAHRVVETYTEAAPLDLAVPASTPDQLGALDGRIASFAQAVHNKRSTAPLELTSEELTALVARIPDLQRVGGQARFTVAEGEVRSDLSLPLDRLGYANRWFNGSATFGVTLENGVLVVTLKSASVRGQAVPQWIVERLGERNLAKDLYEKPDVAAFISRLESIRAADGRLVIVARSR